MSTMVLKLVGLCFAALSAGVLARDVSRPYELVVHRDPDTLQCSHLTIRDTQLFRALPDQGYLKSTILKTGEEKIQFIAEDEDRVWARAEAICGEKSTWSFHTLVQGVNSAVQTDQLVMHSARAEPIPLEVSPLITSGDASKRVDLIFFADGCEYDSCLYLHA